MRFERRVRSGVRIFWLLEKPEMDSVREEQLGLGTWPFLGDSRVGCTSRGLDAAATVLPYAGSAMLDQHDFAWWTVLRTGWVLSVASHLVWEAYDTGRLWWVPPRVRSAFQCMDADRLRVVLGTDGYDDLWSLNGLVEAVP